MKSVEEYLRHAMECEALARGNMSDEERQMLMSMADTWRMLAKRREQMLAMRRNEGSEPAKKPKKH
jgi:DnaJ-domain-containing protein 1